MIEEAGNSPARESPGPRGALGARSFRVMGVDPGTETTGYGVVDSDGSHHRLVEYAGIRAPARFAFAERLLIIAQKLEEVIERLRPQAFSVEETFYAANVKTALKLGHVRGVILVCAARAGVPVFEYSPLEIKSDLVGYGRAEKQQVQHMVRVVLGLKELPEPLDASDALAAAICHIHRASTQRMLDASDRRK
ncbi:MAG TPA: crossover junction endodeoxyribonuclease RuvC [Blastocatellia bacterium]|nr:crossover junction endodeoxyribonuclease RuvC [Blastocatellia bacterium]